MRMEHVPRVMLAGVGSGSGKTTITCGLLAALKRRGMKAATCKCGPDYIDPMFHEQIHHFPSTNLDLFFVQNDIVRYLLQRNAKGTNVSVIEGVMGFYDGCGMTTDAASSYDLTKQTQTPAILILPAKGIIEETADPDTVTYVAIGAGTVMAGTIATLSILLSKARKRTKVDGERMIQLLNELNNRKRNGNNNNNYTSGNKNYRRREDEDDFQI